MEVMKQQAQHSSLNPDAPIFIPMRSYQTVEDFSDQWWDLVHSSPFFLDYWLQDSFDYSAPDLFDNDDLALPDFDAFFDLYLPPQQDEEKEEDKKREKELISMGALKWNRSKPVETPRNFEKVPKIVKSVRVNPRTIHQPR